jgi:hypothetical protein
MREAGGERATCVPAAACGIAPAGQPCAGATLTVGISVRTGSTILGSRPMSAPVGSFEVSPQAASKSRADDDDNNKRFMTAALATRCCQYGNRRSCVLTTGRCVQRLRERVSE